MADWNGRLVTEQDYLAGLYRLRERAAYANGQQYAVGDHYSYSGISYIVSVAHLSTSITDTINKSIQTSMPDPNTSNMLRNGFACTPVWQYGSSSSATLAVNTTQVVRFPVGRSCTVTAVTFDVVTAVTSAAATLHRYVSDGSGGLIYAGVLATAVAAAAVGLKVSTVSIPMIAGEDLYVGITGVTAAPTIRRNAGFDPELKHNVAASQSLNGGFTGYSFSGSGGAVANSSLMTGAAPRIMLTAA